MKESTMLVINDLIIRNTQFKSIEHNLTTAVNILIDSFKYGKKLLVCGNGGSAADALHIVGELMKDFRIQRKIPSAVKRELEQMACEDSELLIHNLQGALPAISLVSEIALETAYANDCDAALSFAQQVLGYGREGDVLLCISTSGNSNNVIYAAEIAKAMNIKVIALTGSSGGKLKAYCDCLINVPEEETYKIQEMHLPIYHSICIALEKEFFG